MRKLALVALLSVALTAASLSARATEAVDLLLVLAADVSRSVDHSKFQLQRDGYAAAIADPRVLGPYQAACIGALRCVSSNGRAPVRRSS